MSSSPEDEGLKLLSSLDPQLACIAAQGWGKVESMVELYTDSIVGGVGGGCSGGGGGGGGGEVREWAVKMMTDSVRCCSETQLLKHCVQWRTLLQTALQSCTTASVLREVTLCLCSLIRRASSSPSLRDFSTTHLPPLLSSLLCYREAEPCLQGAVLPGVAAIFHHYPTSCKSQRSDVLAWGKEGLMNSDLSLSRKSARLLVVTHQNPDQWTTLLSSSLSVLSSSLLHLSHTLTQTTPPSEDLNLDLPDSEPQRSSNLLKLIASHCRLLSLLLLSPPSSPISLPLITLVDVVSFGLKINQGGVSITSTDSNLLLCLLPIIHSSLLTLLSSLVLSAKTRLFPFSSHIDSALTSQIRREGGVVWWRCVSGALCEWVKVRGVGGGGGKSDGFMVAAVRWLLKACCSEDERKREMGLRSVSVLMAHTSSSLPPQLSQEVWKTAIEVLATSPPPSPVVLLAAIRLSSQCLLSTSSSTNISTTVRIFQKFFLHQSSKVSEASQHALALCTRLLHPLGPPWFKGHLATTRSPSPHYTNPRNSSTNHTPSVAVETALGPVSPPGGSSLFASSSITIPEVSRETERRKRNREEEGEVVLTINSIRRNEDGTKDVRRKEKECASIGSVAVDDRVECTLIGSTPKGADYGGGGGGVEYRESNLELKVGVVSEEEVAVTEEQIPPVKKLKGNGGQIGQAQTTDREDEDCCMLMEEEIERAQDDERGGGEGGGRGDSESDDSDVADILATFVSSPSHTTDSELSS